MRIIIAGNGKIGSMLARQLASEGYDITIIDSDKNALAGETERLDVMTCEGNCAAAATLRDAGVMNADLLIAATGSDEVNLLCCMTARALNPKIHAISRIRNSEYTEQAYSMKDIFAIPMVFNPERQAAVEIERLIRYPGFLKRDTFTKGRVEIVELKIDSSSKLCGRALSEIHSIVKADVLICAVLRGGEAITPDGNFVLESGDRIFVTASADNLSSMLRSLGIVTHRAKNVIIAGGGRLSRYLAAMLIRRRIGVKIIEKNHDTCMKLSEKLPEADIIEGDASVQELLESEGLSSCDALVTLTGIDEINMVISLYGSSAGVPQIITKLGKLDDAKIISDLSLGSIISPRRLSCNTVVQYVRAMKNQTGAALSLHLIADGKAEAVEFAVEKNTKYCGVPLKELKTKKNVLIACITKKGEPIIPNGDSCFEVGDNVVVVTVGDTVLTQLGDIFD